jgi:thiol:disulfide interchange protein DsbD
MAELEQRLASLQGKPAVLDFYADWCVSCKEMEKFTFTDPKVAEKLQGFVRLQVDVTGNNADDQALLKRFNLFGPPGIILFNPAGQEVATARVIGFQAATQFLASLRKVLP